MIGPQKYNPARRQAAALVNLARSYIRDGIAPAAGIERLRLAAEALPLDVEILIEALIRALPDDTRAGAMGRLGVMHRLAGSLASAFTIGAWHFDAGETQDKARLRLRAKAVMRESPRARARTTTNAQRMNKLQSDVRERHPWPFRLADSTACAIKVRKALGYKEANEWPRPATVRRAIAAVLKATPKR